MADDEEKEEVFRKQSGDNEGDSEDDSDKDEEEESESESEDGEEQSKKFILTRFRFLATYINEEKYSASQFWRKEGVILYLEDLFFNGLKVRAGLEICTLIQLKTKRPHSRLDGPTVENSAFSLPDLFYNYRPP